MASSGHVSSPACDALHRVMPQLYKFAIVLTANEQLSRALLRGTHRALNGRREWRGRERENILDALHRMHALWMAKMAEDAATLQKSPPEPRLFAGSFPKSSPAGNAHFAKFIANLPSQQRAALYLVYGERASYDEAAEVLCVNMLALMKLLSRGHLALAHWLDHRGFNDGASSREDGRLGNRIGAFGGFGGRDTERVA